MNKIRTSSTALCNIVTSPDSPIDVSTFITHLRAYCGSIDEIAIVAGRSQHLDIVQAVLRDTRANLHIRRLLAYGLMHSAPHGGNHLGGEIMKVILRNLTGKEVAHRGRIRGAGGDEVMCILEMLRYTQDQSIVEVMVRQFGVDICGPHVVYAGTSAARDDNVDMVRAIVRVMGFEQCVHHTEAQGQNWISVASTHGSLRVLQYVLSIPGMLPGEWISSWYPTMHYQMMDRLSGVWKWSQARTRAGRIIGRK